MAADEVQVWLRTLGSRPVRVDVDSLDDDAARVRVASSGSVGTSTEGLLQLYEVATGSIVLLPVMTGLPEPADGHQVVDLFFIDGTTIAEEAARRVRRRSIRCVPSHDEVAVAVKSERPGADPWLPVSVVDLAAPGLAIELAVGAEPATPFTSGTFQVWLPGDETLDLTGTIRNRSRRSSDRVRYGFEFGEPCDAIERWVADRRAVLVARVIAAEASSSRR